MTFIEMFRNNPVTALLAILIMLALLGFAVLVGLHVLTAVLRGAAWIVPRLDSGVLALLRWLAR